VAAVRILSGNEKDEAAGPSSSCCRRRSSVRSSRTSPPASSAPTAAASARSSKAKVVAGTFVTVNGEGALLYELDAKAAKELAKPSELLAAQFGPLTRTRPG
jgi:hypothetical protein